MALLRRRERERYPAARDDEVGTPTLGDSMHRWLEDFLHGLDRPLWPTVRSTPMGEFRPSIDVVETDGDIKVTAELPGMTEEDINVELEDDLLAISGEKKEEKEEEEGARYCRETSYGSFRREVELPCMVEVDKAAATFKNGTLRVTLPKSEEAKARRRPVKIRAE